MKEERRGGARPGAGRPQSKRNVSLHIKVSQESKDILDEKSNVSEYIDNLIIEDNKT